MRVVHLKDSEMNMYINIESIVKFEIRRARIDDKTFYNIELFTIAGPIILAYRLNTKEEAEKIIENLLTVINTVENEIIEYTVKEDKQ